MNIKIVYYSGTSGALRVAECFKKQFEEKGHKVLMQRLSKNGINEKGQYDILVLIFAVYAFTSPKVVDMWLKDTINVQNKKAVVISVSGGGEVSPNTACRVRAIKKLENKGYIVMYENMVVMPSNIFIKTNKPIDKILLDILPIKVMKMVEDIDKNLVRRTKPYFFDKILAIIGISERFGGKVFGKLIKVKEDCNGCGRCVKNCPAGNIKLIGDKPNFYSDCYMCLNCIYGCSEKAIKPIMAKFILIKDGYDLSEVENREPIEGEIDIENLTKGYLWSGVREYILNE